MSEHLNKETFRDKVFNFEKNKEWKYEGTLPALVDFWAPWCGPCRLVGPVIDELSKDYAGKVNFYKVNTEEEQELAGMFGIQSIPSLLFIPVSGEPKMALGALPKKELKRIIESELIPSMQGSTVTQ
jgi:thioredoxin